MGLVMERSCFVNGEEEKFNFIVLFLCGGGVKRQNLIAFIPALSKE